MSKAVFELAQREDNAAVIVSAQVQLVLPPTVLLLVLNDHTSSGCRWNQSYQKYRLKTGKNSWTRWVRPVSESESSLMLAGRGV
jgi:hypothetical protein